MHFFDAHGVRLAYRLDGPDDAPALVLLNSLGTDMRMWDAQIALLSRSLRIIRCDYRGHGASDVPPEPYTIEQFGLDLLTLLDTLQIERVSLCGLSLGGIVALWFAAQYPGRIARVVLANTAARIGTAESWQARIDRVRQGGMAAVREMVLTRFLSEEFRRTQPEMTRQIGEMLEATPPEGYRGACAALRDADLRERLANIRIPSLIIAGELDEATPPAQAQDLHGGIAGSELVMLQKAAHLSNIEQPEGFSRAVLAFLMHS